MSRYAILLFSILLLLASQAFAFEPLFDGRIDYDVEGSPTSVFASDFDGDGDNDLAVANQYSYDISILRNNGNGTFQPAVNYDVGRYPASLFVCDFDMDGSSDLAVTNSRDVSILRNNGDGTFQSAVKYGVGDYPMSTFAADLDGDGDNDLAVANRNSDNVSILFNRTIRTDIQNETARLPIQYRLSQNFPNPFNVQTTIQYSLPTQSLVSIDIFDILGRRIAQLNNGTQEPGSHEIIWDATGISSGVYFYKLTAGEHRETRMMLLLK